MKYNSVRYVWSKVVIERLIEKKDIGAINSFIYYYNDPNEQAIYNNSPWKEQIEELRKPSKKKPTKPKIPEFSPPSSPWKPTLTLTEYLKQLEQENSQYVDKGT